MEESYLKLTCALAIKEIAVHLYFHLVEYLSTSKVTTRGKEIMKILEALEKHEKHKKRHVKIKIPEKEKLIEGFCFLLMAKKIRSLIASKISSFSF